MTLNKFGRSSARKLKIAPPTAAPSSLSYTPYGDIDFENLKLCNVKRPSLDTDAATKQYVDELKNFFVTQLNENTTDTNGEFLKIKTQFNQLTTDIKSVITTFNLLKVPLKTNSDRIATLNENFIQLTTHCLDIHKQSTEEFQKVKDKINACTGDLNKSKGTIKSINNNFMQLTKQLNDQFTEVHETLQMHADLMQDPPIKETNLVNKKYVDTSNSFVNDSITKATTSLSATLNDVKTEQTKAVNDITKIMQIYAQLNNQIKSMEEQLNEMSQAISLSGIKM